MGLYSKENVLLSEEVELLPSVYYNVINEEDTLDPTDINNNVMGGYLDNHDDMIGLSKHPKRVEILNNFTQARKDLRGKGLADIKREIDSRPKTWLASKIAKFRNLYTKFLAELNKERDLRKQNLIRKFLRVILRIIDWIAIRLQKLANHIGKKDDKYSVNHILSYQNKKYNGQLSAIEKSYNVNLPTVLKIDDEENFNKGLKYGSKPKR